MIKKLASSISKELNCLFNTLVAGFILGTLFGYNHTFGKAGIAIAVLGYPVFVLLRGALRLIVAVARFIDRRAGRKGGGPEISYKGAVLSISGKFLQDLKSSPLSAASFVLSTGVSLIYIILCLQEYVEFWALYTSVMIGCVCGIIAIVSGLIAFHKTGKGIAIISVIISAMVTILFNLRYFEFLFKK